MTEIAHKHKACLSGPRRRSSRFSRHFGYISGLRTVFFGADRRPEHAAALL